MGKGDSPSPPNPALSHGNTVSARAPEEEKSLPDANRNERSQGCPLLHGQDMGKTQDHRNSMEQWLAVAGGWRLAVGGWRLAVVGGSQGQSLRAVLNIRNNITGLLKDHPANPPPPAPMPLRTRCAPCPCAGAPGFCILLRRAVPPGPSAAVSQGLCSRVPVPLCQSSLAHLCACAQGCAWGPTGPRAISRAVAKALTGGGKMRLGGNIWRIKTGWRAAGGGQKRVAVPTVMPRGREASSPPPPLKAHACLCPRTRVSGGSRLHVGEVR